MRGIKIYFCALAILVILVGQAFAGSPVVLKFATIEPPQSFNVKDIWGPYFDKINKAGEGVLKIVTYPGGTLGRDPRQQIKLLKGGVFDMCQVVNAYHQADRLADDQVVGAPFTYRNCPECSMAVHYMHEKKLLRGYEDLVVLGQVCISEYAIHTNFPVRVPSDLKGKKLRTSGKIYHALGKAFGATPVAIQVTKVAESISRGLVDGTLQDWTGMDVFRINDVTSFHCTGPFGTNMLMIVMTKKRYDKLPQDARAILDKFIGRPFIEFWSWKLQGHIDRIKDSIRKSPKHTIYTPNEEEMKQWRNVINPVMSSWNKEYDRWDVLLEGYKEAIAKARETGQ